MKVHKSEPTFFFTGPTLIKPNR